MSLEENKNVVRRFIEAYNEQNLDSFDDLVGPNYFNHASQVDKEGLRQLLIAGFKGFPDWYEVIEDIVAEGDKVWIRLSYTATHTGEWFGIAPTGNKITAMAVDIYRIVDGKLGEYWNVTDGLDFFKQLGLIEYTEKGKKFFP